MLWVITMQRSYVFLAWKWLLGHLFIAASIGYIAAMLAARVGHVEPRTLLKTMSFGLPHAGMMITSQGSVLGANAWLTYFFCNLTVALLIVVVVYWAQLLNPHPQNRSFSRLRKHLQKDRSAEYLRKIAFFTNIHSSELRLASFLLLVVPLIATTVLGLMAGAAIGVGHVFSSSPLIALAYILPHGIPEIAAILLACSIPVEIWITIRPAVNNNATIESFRSIELIFESQQFQQNLKMIINLLVIAALIEAHLTTNVVAMVSSRLS